MTREEQRTALLVRRIKDNCYEVSENLLKEHDKQIRAEVIDEYSSELFKVIEMATVNCKFDFTIDDLHNLEIVIKGLAEQLKEQNK